MQLELATVRDEKNALIKELAEWQNWWAQGCDDPVMNVETILEALGEENAKIKKVSDYENGLPNGWQLR